MKLNELEKIDIIRQRLNVTYKEAKEALDMAKGDLVQALVILEEKENNLTEKLQERGNQLLAQIKQLIQKGNITRIKLKKGDETVLEIPATLGALGVLAALASTELAVIAGLGTVAAWANKYTLEIERPDGQKEEKDVEL
ncbi:hypothetical protein Moth_0602 [Calderihabitans maritimus]|uniref:DUF4342 domain-containing protein n=1 Tax=Calderihabitans maritimus TaxID=1246530 RepID=A0A1Z5HVJ7_9FIRM|nr:hypothetical protein Moth_0602 [Calderihabitans maritimus]